MHRSDNIRGAETLWVKKGLNYTDLAEDRALLPRAMRHFAAKEHETYV